MIRRKRELIKTSSSIRNHLKRRHSQRSFQCFLVMENLVNEVYPYSTGSNAMLISESLANKLQLGEITKEIRSTKFFSMTNKVPSKSVNLSISSRSHPEMLMITNSRVIHDLNFSTFPEKISFTKGKFWSSHWHPIILFDPGSEYTELPSLFRSFNPSFV